ncbi:hypothetical protein [Alkalihalobacterium chitinilyticum]|uniref:Restriction endonuclease n=1 Tax=Alkalihalobacterium chitinilyticum TaxID=2980103 RepID=A0ABT5VFN0_9BACI|nr:hypothetical protein [Alkalihalobacterium chitinilyticum]MDE5414234.1 hypothetical protein [Alkalihalobacterium chitinilyticum]
MRLTERRQFDPEDGTHKNVYQFNNTKDFDAMGSFGMEVIEEVFDFAYGMSFGQQGHHRNHRSGGTARRGNGAIFADAFQGKLAEFALYQVLQNHGIDVERPDTEMFGEGEWDSSDFTYGGKKIAVKSTKAFGQLLLLEAEDWNNEGLYVPNLGTGDEFYDYFVLVRVDPFAENLLMQNRLYFTPDVPEDELRQIILAEEFSFDLPGCMTRNTLVWMIENNYFIPQHAYINRIAEKNKLDADNYYLQTGDLHDVNRMIQEL